MEDKNDIDLNELSELGKKMLQEDNLMDEASMDLDKRFKESKQPKSSLWKIITLIIVLTGMIYLSYLALNTSDKNMQYAQVEPIPSSLVPITRSTEPQDNPISKAVRHYSNKDYESASLIFNSLIADGRDSLGYAKLFQSSILAISKDYKGSLNLQEDIKNNEIKDIVEWHMFLNYQHIDMARAKQQLEDIANDNEHYKKAEAKVLLANYN